MKGTNSTLVVYYIISMAPAVMWVLFRLLNTASKNLDSKTSSFRISKIIFISDFAVIIIYYPCMRKIKRLMISSISGVTLEP